MRSGEERAEGWTGRGQGLLRKGALERMSVRWTGRCERSLSRESLPDVEHRAEGEAEETWVCLRGRGYGRRVEGRGRGRVTASSGA